MSSTSRLVLFHALATAEYLRARRRYAGFSATLAQAFQDALQKVIEKLETNPSLGAPFGSRFRWLRLRRFPYCVYYAETSPVVVKVFAVAHTQRRPGYWIRRANP